MALPENILYSCPNIRERCSLGQLKCFDQVRKTTPPSSQVPQCPSSSSTYLHCLFCDDYGVESCTTQELITRAEELKTMVSKNQALPNTAHLDIFLACGIQGHWVLQ
mmetsp:Transcript_68096/g.120197  ORF Transcript_68096/g.120197 Transcript_68096/m.120197 type:complete len:107 (+) Transcript_68096:96-416(+)